jgi:hypothetical protein
VDGGTRYKQAGDRGGRTALDQQIQQRTAAQRQPSTDQAMAPAAPGSSAWPRFQQCQRQRDHQRRGQLDQAGSAHVAWRHMALLVKRSNRDADQRQCASARLSPWPISPRPNFCHTTSSQARQNPAPGRSTAAGRPCPPCAGHPHGRQHRLQALPAAPPARRPCPALTAAQTPPRYPACISTPVTARCPHCRRPLGSARAPTPPTRQNRAWTAGSAAPETSSAAHEACHTRHDEAGAPDQHKNHGHGLQPPVGRTMAYSGRHLARARISGKAFCR